MTFWPIALPFGAAFLRCWDELNDAEKNDDNDDTSDFDEGDV